MIKHGQYGVLRKKATVKVNTPVLPEITKVTVKGSTVTVTLKTWINMHMHTIMYLESNRKKNFFIMVGMD